MGTIIPLIHEARILDHAHRDGDIGVPLGKAACTFLTEIMAPQMQKRSVQAQALADIFGDPQRYRLFVRPDALHPCVNLMVEFGHYLEALTAIQSNLEPPVCICGHALVALKHMTIIKRRAMMWHRGHVTLRNSCSRVQGKVSLLQ